MKEFFLFLKIILDKTSIKFIFKEKSFFIFFEILLFFFNFTFNLSALMNVRYNIFLILVEFVNPATEIVQLVTEIIQINALHVLLIEFYTLEM
jgi:hypothetical protein